MEEITQKLYCYIDESGTLPDLKDTYIVMCGVVVPRLEIGEHIISNTLYTLRQLKRPIQEIKFYYAGQNTKRQFLSGMIAADVKIFSLILDKKGRKVPDSPQNFALLATELLSEILRWYGEDEYGLSYVFDRHFARKSDQEMFNEILFATMQNSPQSPLEITHVDSQNNALVNIADMSAGSILWKYTGKDQQFYNIIKDNIIVERIMGWPELKRKYIKQKLT